MRLRKFALVVAAVVLASGASSGCSILSADDPEPKMHVNEAVKRVDAVLDDTFDAIRPKLKWRDGPAKISEGRNSFTNTANGEVTVGRTRYVRTKVSKAKLTELVKAVAGHWRGAGFKVGEMRPAGPSFSATAPDGCTIDFSVGGYDNISLSAGVGAISPGYGDEIEGEEGDKFPKAPNGGPDYAADVRDPYWSK
ncbi:hypothetical protein AB0C96_22060 [Streptomyces sp. NPDC048506]|uniref:hypothetical protein n=1 Tax=Streptomyces sp. NPDC048506 TaxID=3155028 RepID=UPI0034188F91